MVPGNPLEHALVAAATEVSARPLFYRLLLESPLFILDGSSSPPVEDQMVVLEKETQVQLVCVDLDGVPHTAVFSSLAVLQSFVQDEQKYISLLGRNLLEMVRGSHLILNPGADYGKQILPDEIDAILNGSAARGYTSHVVEKDTQVLLGQPRTPPTHLTEALSSVFGSRKDVRAAYLALCAFPESKEQHLMVGIEATGDWDGLMRSISPTLEASVRSGEIVDIIRMSASPKADPIEAYMRRTRPFYKKKILGLF